MLCFCFSLIYVCAFYFISVFIASVVVLYFAPICFYRLLSNFTDISYSKLIPLCLLVRIGYFLLGVAVCE